MQKGVLIVLVLLLLLASCYVALMDDQAQTSTPSFSEGTTRPIISTGPSISSTGPSTAATEPSISSTEPSVPETNSPTPGVEIEEMEGYAFIFRGRQPAIEFETDLSKLVEGWLYYINLQTQVITPICEETIVALTEDDYDTDFVYYVKASEPTVIYRTNQKEPKEHAVIYESTFGPVNGVQSDDYSITNQNVLQLVADNKYFVVLDLETGEAFLVMEQHFLESAFFNYGSHETWDEHNYVFFVGKLKEDEKTKNYLYEIDTGRVAVEEDDYDE